MQGNNIHIPFHHHQIRRQYAFGAWRTHSRTGTVQPEQQPPLGKDRSFRPIEVFGLPITQNTPTKGNQSPFAIPDGKSDAPPEQLTLGVPVLIHPHQAGFGHHLGRNAFGCEGRNQFSPPLTRPTQAEGFQRFPREATPQQVIQPGAPFRFV